MDEESRFWLVPIICFISVGVIIAFAVDYKFNTVFPNAEIERLEIKNMTCSEILLKDSSNRYWSTENKKIGNTKAIGCIEKPQSSGLNPYVEFCNPGGFAPVKKIENSTHSFNHDTCIWDMN